MKSIEKSLTSYLNGTVPKVSNEELIKYSFESKEKVKDIIDILFRVINYNLDSYNGDKPLDKIRELLGAVTAIMLDNNDVDRKVIARKARSLDYRLDNLIESNKAKIKDKDKASDEIEKTRLVLNEVCDQIDEKEPTKYEMVELLASTDDVNLIHRVFNKQPSLVNAKDKEKVSFFENIVIKYVNSISVGNEKDAMYYSKLLSIIINHQNFNLSDKDKKSCLETINTLIDKMSYNKKKEKKNIEHIEFLRDLVNTIKGEEKSIKIDELSRRYSISISFDPKIIEQVNNIKTKTGTMTDRKIVDDYTITIDDEDAIEIDDALTCKILPNGNYLLGVHIASVLGYFPWNSDIVREAISRSRSIYLPKKYQNVNDDYNRIIPIFPYSFSAQIASLIPGDSKLARSYFFEIDIEGNIVKEEFKKSIVRSNKKATYAEVDDVLRNGSDNKEFERTVNCLKEVTNIISKRYITKEVYEIIKTVTDDFSDLPVKTIGAQNIINKAMLLTGDRVANFFFIHNYPCLYRVHESNEENERKIQSIIDDWKKSYGDEKQEQLFRLISGIYPRGKYGIEGAHSGLGLEHYCHCTSGLRRAPDIVVEHALEVCYDKVPTDEEILQLQHEISIIAKEINLKQITMDGFISDYKSGYYKKRYYS